MLSFRLSKPSRAAALIEYGALVGVLGVGALLAVGAVGDEASRSFGENSMVLESLTRPALPAVVVVPTSGGGGAEGPATLSTVRTSPYDPSYAQDPGRLYVEFAMGTWQFSGGGWGYAPALAADLNPGQVFASSPSLSAGPVIPGAGLTALGLCLFAQQNTGEEMMDPARSFYPHSSLYAGDPAEIRLEHVLTVPVSKAEQAAAYDAALFEDAASTSPSGFVEWDELPDPQEVVVAFTCSRPVE